MSKIVIGESDGKELKVDIDLLIPSRLLIQANSGGGKSFLLRRLAEQLYGKVQTVIIDPEGEFYTLREKFGYVLVGEGGETPADVRSAALLAEKFLQLKVSAVCDLFESFRSQPMARRQWVRSFLNALLDSPRALWHPLVVIVDEAHKFCPQETPKAASMFDREIIGGCKEAMIAMSTTGRKRGFCSIWATQRLAKLDKDASAEFFNRLVGMTIEDVDVDRAADLMSVSKEEKHDFRNSLRQLNPGQFYAFGRAIATERKLVLVGGVVTHHPETGNAARNAEPPPMPEEVRRLLPQLADLPKEAEDKARTEAEFKKEIRELKTKLATAEKARPAAVASTPVVDQRAISAAVKPFRDRLTAIKQHLSRAARSLPIVAGALVDAESLVSEMPTQPVAPAPQIPVRVAAPSVRPAVEPNSNGKLRDGARRMLSALCQFYPAGMPEGRLRSHAGMAKSGTFSTYKSDLFRYGYIEKRGDDLFATEAGIDFFGGDIPATPTTTEDVLAIWNPKLRDGARRMLACLIAHHGEEISREQLFAEAGLTMSGTASTYLSDLRRTQLVIVSREGVAANRETLFL